MHTIAEDDINDVGDDLKKYTAVLSRIDDNTLCENDSFDHKICLRCSMPFLTEHGTTVVR